MSAAVDRIPRVSALVVYESLFGNTENIARAIAGGLRLEGVSARVVDLLDDPMADPSTYQLLVAGGPTHAFALSRSSTRADAAARGGEERYGDHGLREWLKQLPRAEGTRVAATFDTRVPAARHLPLSAARSAARLLRARGFTLVSSPTGFIVHDVDGPLEQHEMEHAIAWGRSVAREAQALLEVDRELHRYDAHRRGRRAP